MIAAMILIAGVSTPHQLDSIALEWRAPLWHVILIENGQRSDATAGAAFPVTWATDPQPHVSIAVDSLRTDIIFRARFE